jgi:hypothetical protein
VEFAGCSGAGKSALYGRVRAMLRSQRIEAISPLELLLSSHVARRLESTRLSNLVLESASRHWTRPALDHYASCWSNARQQIDRHSVSLRERWRLRRSCRRKLSVAYGSHQIATNQIVLVDEGTVQLTHILFGRRTNWDSTEIDRFVASLPLPDVLVQVTAPLQVVQRRIDGRGRPPLPDRSELQRRQFLAQSRAIFAQACQIANLQSRWLVVNNAQSDLDALEMIAHRVAQRVIAFQQNPNQNENENTVHVAGPRHHTHNRPSSGRLAVHRPRLAHPA